MRKFSLAVLRYAVLGVGMATGLMSVAPTMSFAQAISVNGGSIDGVITDPSGATVAGAAIVIANPDAGYKKAIVTDKAGLYSVGPLTPGNYTVTVSAPGFETLKVTTVVRTGTVTSGSFKLVVGSTGDTIEVAAGALQVNTDQAGVSDVITAQQIDSLPVNGRNFLDLAQVEPGVILQAGSTFDPTKAGYSAISVGGVSGRTTRILLDGQDITDETVGTTIFNVSQGSVGEFQLNRSTQDVSGEVTTTGQVLVSTRSGTNSIHGMGFYNFQDARAVFASATPGFPPSPFQRNQFGGSLGGPIWKDKLFFFGNAERIKQTQAAAASFGTLFQSTTNLGNGSPITTPLNTTYPTYSTPYKENYLAGRVDYNGPLGGHYFARINDNFNGNAAGTQFSLYSNRDNTWGLATGADFNKGHFTHSFRGGYEKFHNFITDVTIGSSGLYNPINGFALNYAGQNVHTGPNSNAPQATYQSDKQIRYDGSWALGAHVVRFGAGLNRIQEGGFAAFYGLGPRANPTDSNQLLGTSTTSNPNALGCNGVKGAGGCLGDPINGYNGPVTMGNGIGYSSEVPAFNLPGGGFPSWRISSYAADSWKVTPTFTLTYGVRWSVDTNRQNNDLAPPTCAQIGSKAAAACAGAAPSTSLFTLWGMQGGNVHTPYANFSPQLGFVYSPGNHKTAFRAGFGIYRESDVVNNTLNSRANLLSKGAFYASITPCTGYSVNFPDPNQTVVTSVNTSGAINPTDGSGVSFQDLCQNKTIAQAAPYWIALQKAYQTSTKANSISSNSTFVGNTLSASGLYGPSYKSPYSEQWNFGVQREISKGYILSADYVHNSTLKIGQTLDVNHQGAARTFNLANAQAAIKATITACKGGTTVDTIIQKGGCPGGSNKSNATIQDFANNGLDSGATYAKGQNFNYAGKANAGAFPGLNPQLGSGAFIQPIGRSGYDALQIVFKGQKSHPVPGIDSGNMQISYNLSRIVSTGSTSDEFFSNAVLNKDNPTAFIGRTSGDRKHQVNIGGSIKFKYGLTMGIIGHFYSALPANLTLDDSIASGKVFQVDMRGDGTTTTPIAPGTLQGDYMHRVKSNTLQGFITNFNSQYAGSLTPAGKAVVNAGLLTSAQMIQIGGAVQPVANLPQANALNNSAYRSMDMSFSYPVKLSKVREGMALTPGISFYNVGNFSNFSAFTGVLYNTTTAGGQTYTGTSGVTGLNNFVAQSSGHRTLRGSGTFDQGGPRSAEFQLKLDF